MYLQYGSTILQDVLFRAGEKTTLTGSNVSDYLDQAKRLVQRSYFDVLEHAPWPWALKDPPGTLTLYKKKTNTSTVAADSTSVTLGTAVATSLAGWWFQVDSEHVPYRVSAHTAGTTGVTLDSAYCEANGTLVACTLFKDEYSLASDCLKPWFAWNRNNPTDRIDIIGAQEMRDRFSGRYHSGTVARVMSVVQGGKVRVRPWPENDNITVEYDYTVAPSADLTFDGLAGTDTPLVPLVDRPILADIALAELYIVKNDPRAQEAGSKAAAKLTQMVTTYLTGNKTRMYVKPGGGVWR